MKLGIEKGMDMELKELHRYWGEGEYENREAIVYVDGTFGYIVRMIEKSKNSMGVDFYRAARSKSGQGEVYHNEQYAEDMAENWCLGIIENGVSTYIS